MTVCTDILHSKVYQYQVFHLVHLHQHMFQHSEIYPIASTDMDFSENNDKIKKEIINYNQEIEKLESYLMYAKYRIQETVYWMKVSYHLNH